MPLLRAEADGPCREDDGSVECRAPADTSIALPAGFQHPHSRGKRWEAPHRAWPVPNPFRLFSRGTGRGLSEKWHARCSVVGAEASIRSHSTSPPTKPRRSTASRSSWRKGRAGFAAEGVCFYTWDDDEGALVGWAIELARVEGGGPATVPGGPRDRAPMVSCSRAARAEADAHWKRVREGVKRR